MGLSAWQEFMAPRIVATRSELPLLRIAWAMNVAMRRNAAPPSCACGGTTLQSASTRSGLAATRATAATSIHLFMIGLAFFCAETHDRMRCRAALRKKPPHPYELSVNVVA